MAQRHDHSSLWLLGCWACGVPSSLVFTPNSVWDQVPLQEVEGRILSFAITRLVVQHQPRNLDVVLVGGSNDSDGAEIAMDCDGPPLTIGVLTGTDYKGESYGNDISDHGEAEWSCWQHAGLARGKPSDRRWPTYPLFREASTAGNNCFMTEARGIPPQAVGCANWRSGWTGLRD